jgi:hypothetical protein
VLQLNITQRTGLSKNNSKASTVKKTIKVRHECKKPVKSSQPKKPLIVLSTDSQKTHVRPKVSMGPHNKKINILDLSLAPLLKKHKTNHVRNRKQITQKFKKKKYVNTKSQKILPLQGVPDPSHFRGTRV